MNINTKFDLGQVVWGIASSYASRLVFCQTCNREGVVTIGAEQFTCPKCNGSSKHPKNLGSRWYVSEHNTRIGKVNTEHYDCSQARYENRITYMIEATGVGSGRIWGEDELFPSEAEALAECELRNAGKIFKDDE